MLKHSLAHASHREQTQSWCPDRNPSAARGHQEPWHNAEGCPWAAPTFHDELGEVGDASAPAGLGDTAVQVLLALGHLVQLEGGQEAPVADVLHGGSGDHLAALPLPGDDGKGMRSV